MTVALGDPKSQQAEAADKAASVPLRADYFTDPLCCWSWAFEPHWLRLRKSLVGQFAWRMHMGGMIRDWRSFHDPLNSIHKPGQMGPLWMLAERETGVSINGSVWLDDPPESSWPACIACKAAERQSSAAGAHYLRRFREELFVNGRNISRQEVQLEVADKCADELPEKFDAARFAEDLVSGETRRSFRSDMYHARAFGIGRFPTLVLRTRDGTVRMLTGWRSYEALAEEIRDIAPISDRCLAVRRATMCQSQILRIENQNQSSAGSSLDAVDLRSAPRPGRPQFA